MSRIIKRIYILSAVCLAFIVVLGIFIARPIEAGPSFAENTADVVVGYTDFVRLYTNEPNHQEEELPPLMLEEPEIVSQPGVEDIFSKIKNILDTMAHVAMYILTALCVLFLGFFILNSFHRRSSLSFEDFDDVVQEDDAEPPAMKRSKRLRLGVNKTVRRLFRAKVRDYMVIEEFRIRKSDTPERIAESIGKWEDVGQLKALYHKARYSGGSVSRSELRALGRGRY